MKKLFALLLALAMVFCLAACGESKGSKDTTTEPTTEPTEEVTTAPTEEPTDAPTEEVTEAPTDATEPNSDETDDAIRGIIEGDVYTNELVQLGFQLPEGWCFASDSEIAQITGLTQDMIGEDMSKLLDQGLSAMVFYAFNDQGTSNVNMNVQKVPGVSALPMDTYTESVCDMIPNLMAQANMTVNSIEAREVEFAGETRLGIFYETEFSGAVLQQFSYYLASGDYLATVTVTCQDADEIPQIIAQFFSTAE